jgi:Tfp pilus assembly protein PilO
MKSNSKQLTSALIAAAFFAAALLIYFEMIVPGYTNLETDKGQELSEQELYTTENNTVTQVQALITTYKSETSSTQLVNLSLPVGPNIASALAQIYGIAASAGFTLESSAIAVQAVQATTAVQTNGSSSQASAAAIVKPKGTVTFQLQGTGSYESLKSFLAGLENNIRIFDVTGVSIQPFGGVAKVGSSDLFNYTLTVVTYYQSS